MSLFSHRKTVCIFVLCAMFLALGLGLVCWAAVNIHEQPSNVSSDPDVPVAEEPVPAEVVPTEPVFLNEGDAVGTLSIPVLNETLPIIEGTGEGDLERGVGHYSQSVLPGEEDNCVLSGHRDTVFANLGDLVIGDLLIVQTTSGTFTYRISGIRIVDKDDRTVIVPTDHAVLTLTTCYPFVFFGDAPNRYIISADLIRSE